MRIRTIKPEFWTHPVMSAQSDMAKLLAVALLNFADDEGYFYADPRMVRNALRPLDDDSLITQRGLNELSLIGYIEVRKHPTHGPIGKVVAFLKHQNISRRTPSKLKALYEQVTELNEDSMRTQCTLNSGTGNREQGTGNKEQGKEKEELRSSPRNDAKASWSEAEGFKIPDSVLAEFAEAYPACDIKAQALRAHIWLKSNPKRKKKDYHRFLTGWLSRAQENGGDDRIAARRAGPVRGGAVVEKTALEMMREKNDARIAEGPEGWRDMLEEAYADDPEILEQIAAAETWTDLIWNFRNAAWSLHDKRKSEGAA